MKRIAIVFLGAFGLLLLAGVSRAQDSDNSNSSSVISMEERFEHLGLIIPDDVRLRFEELDRQPSPILLNPAEYFDWRDMGGVTAVKDQGGCGSCWDFAATGAFESAIKIANEVEWDLSEQQVLDCNTERYGCGGGWMSSVYSLFMNYGAIEEQCYPYYAQDGFPCEQDTCVVIAVLDDYVDIQNDIDAIKNALLTSPLSTTLTIPEGFNWDCFQGDWVGADHAVVIVGWDDAMCGDQGGWIVKNSWSAGWGDQGFFYIPYGSCGIGHYTQIPLFEGGGAKLTLNQRDYEFDLPTGGQASEMMHLSNPGQENLYFRLRSYCLQDSFGYYWLESEIPRGPQYSWVDITESGEPIDFPGYPGYSNSGPIDFGFDFSFYGNVYSSICVCSNGWASFTDSDSRTSLNQPIPTPSAPNNLLAPFWENLNPDGDDIYFYTNNADTAVISWVNVPDIANRGLFTFQILLIGDHTVVYQYQSMGPEGPLNSATIGIENAAGSVGLEVAYNEIFTYGEKSVKFDVGQPVGEFDWLTTDIDYGMIPPGTGTDMEITCFAGDHLDGSYWACLELYTNDSDNKLVEIPVVMNIGATGIADADKIPDDFGIVSCYPNPFNAGTNIEYSLNQPSSVTLEIFDILGRKVETISSGEQTAGRHIVTWDAENKSSGIYYCSISSGDTHKSLKLVLLK